MIKRPTRGSPVLLVLAFLLMGMSAAQEAGEAGRVMTWVPPYAVEACRERLEQSSDGAGMDQGLTHLGLQFWQPTTEGGITLVDRFQPIDDATIAAFREWGDSHGVRTLLCVYNGTADGWDWDLARAAFGTHRERFIEALVSETSRLDLDGVDIDLEGEGNHEEDREAFICFIEGLSGRLHAEGKELTVDTFAYKWNAPNQGWWADLLPHIDGLHVMGYAETGDGAADWRSYDAIKAASGEHASKVLIGMPSHAAEWQGKSAIEQIHWIVEDGAVGLAIWDAQLKDQAWRSKRLWQEIGRIRGGDR